MSLHKNELSTIVYTDIIFLDLLIFLANKYYNQISKYFVDKKIIDLPSK